MKLTILEKRFCENYVENPKDRVAAFLKAGYSAPNRKKAHDKASTILKRKKIKEYIDELMDLRKKASIMSREEILEQYSVIARASNEDIMLKDKLKALEMLGKYYGLFKEIVETETTISIQLPEGFDDVGDEF